MIVLPAVFTQVPIFIQFNGFPPHIDAAFQGRVKLIEGASIELRDIEMTDEGWYECSIVFLDGGTSEHNDANGTWVYLSVNGNVGALQPFCPAHCELQSCPWVGLTHGLGWVGSGWVSQLMD